MPSPPAGFELVRPLHVGPHREVWLARQLAVRARLVALKWLTADDELEWLSLEHGAIVKVYDLLEVAGQPVLVMQWAEGGSLADVVENRGRLSPGEVVSVGAIVAEALHHAHTAGLSHGDVKASNILLTTQGQPLLADFARAGATPRYTAPEVARLHVSSPQGDQYSLGVTCHEALTGRPWPPWPGVEVDIPLALRLVIDQATAPAPADRFESLNGLAMALRAAEASTPLDMGGRLIASDGNFTPIVGACTRPFGPRPHARDERPMLAVPHRLLALCASVLTCVFLSSPWSPFR